MPAAQELYTHHDTSTAYHDRHPGSWERRIHQVMPSFNQRGIQKRVEWEKVFDVFRGKLTGTMFDRHAAIFDRLEKIHKDGIPLKDLGHVATVLDLVREKILEGGTVIIPNLCKYLVICRDPFIDEKDDRSVAELQEDLHRYANALSDLVRTEDIDVIQHVAEAVFHLCGGPKLAHLQAEHRIVTTQLREGKMEALEMENPALSLERADAELLAIMQKTSIIKNFTRILEVVQGDFTRLTILRVLRRMSASPFACQQMVQEGTLDKLGHLMEEADDDAVISIVIETLWNCLEREEQSKASSILSSEDSLSRLRSIFHRLSVNSHRQIERQLRNELLIVCISIGVHEPESLRLFAGTGFLEEFWIVYTQADFGVGSADGRHVFAAADLEEYEFKQLGLVFIKVLCRHEANLGMFLERGLLRFMFMYLDFDSPESAVNKWNLRQIKGLQVQIINFLEKLAPTISRNFTHGDGTAHLLAFLKSAIPKDRGIDQDGCNLTSEVVGLVPAILRLLFNISELGAEEKGVLGGDGYFDVLLELLCDKSQPSDVWRITLLVCSSLCQETKNNKETFEAGGGVEAAIPFLKYHSANPNEENLVQLAAVECVWGAVCGSSNSEEKFFAQGGVFALLDLLERGPMLIKRHALGCILDLAENSKALPHLMEWRTNKNEHQGIGHLLIELWTEEERKLGVYRDQQGTVSTTHLHEPLHGTDTRRRILTSNMTDENSPAIGELSENLRAKVYSMFCKLGFEQYQDILPLNYRIKLTLIAKYLDFKIGEVWDEISAELEYEGIRPVTPDLECVSTAKEVTVDKANVVLQQQLELIKIQREHDRAEELEFYEHFRQRESMKKRTVDGSESRQRARRA
ncbi:hypothetical protein HK097_004045 [Rhizophlyctis rosea]|uniref:Cilia- and flagella-associated protein 69 ARM repeats domain-containing protein n=1 Tax=Rhizophlyctis rosea TaxID=64517 RepID=A0AAD5SKT2_9FUNG|nr:hypothetical protein HK097_004045 [Rhizophlyctis rosea]